MLRSAVYWLVSSPPLALVGVFTNIFFDLTPALSKGEGASCPCIASWPLLVA